MSYQEISRDLGRLAGIIGKAIVESVLDVPIDQTE